jgi:hypothetical protein
MAKTISAFTEIDPTQTLTEELVIKLAPGEISLGDQLSYKWDEVIFVSAFRSESEELMENVDIIVRDKGMFVFEVEDANELKVGCYKLIDKTPSVASHDATLPFEITSGEKVEVICAPVGNKMGFLPEKVCLVANDRGMFVLPTDSKNWHRPFLRWAWSNIGGCTLDEQKLVLDIKGLGSDLTFAGDTDLKEFLAHCSSKVQADVTPSSAKKTDEPKGTAQAKEADTTTAEKEDGSETMSKSVKGGKKLEKAKAKEKAKQEKEAKKQAKLKAKQVKQDKKWGKATPAEGEGQSNVKQAGDKATPAEGEGKDANETSEAKPASNKKSKVDMAKMVEIAALGVKAHEFEPELKDKQRADAEAAVAGEAVANACIQQKLSVKRTIKTVYTCAADYSKEVEVIAKIASDAAGLAAGQNGASSAEVQSVISTVYATITSGDMTVATKICGMSIAQFLLRLVIEHAGDPSAHVPLAMDAMQCTTTAATHAGLQKKEQEKAVKAGLEEFIKSHATIKEVHKQGMTAGMSHAWGMIVGGEHNAQLIATNSAMRIVETMKASAGNSNTRIKVNDAYGAIAVMCIHLRCQPGISDRVLEQIMLVNDWPKPQLGR